MPKIYVRRNGARITVEQSKALARKSKTKARKPVQAPTPDVTERRQPPIQRAKGKGLGSLPDKPYVTSGSNGDSLYKCQCGSRQFQVDKDIGISCFTCGRTVYPKVGYGVRDRIGKNAYK